MNCLAFDLGASSGRAILGHFDGNKIELNEIHRFTNDPVMIGDTLYWDVLRLFHEIKEGIRKAGTFESIGVDTWGVDFALIDKDGLLMENPVHYRDKRTHGMIQKAQQYMSGTDIYKNTGIQLMEINTLFQLLSIKEKRPHMLDNASTILLMPDYLNYLLTGIKKTEYSIASTTGLLDPATKTWSDKIFDVFSLPKQLFTNIIPSGTVLGKLSQSICLELGVESVPVIATASHDTASAVVSVPTNEKDFIYISCGTWSLFGTELDTPIINERSLAHNVTNEGGINGSTRFLKNIIGLWLIQECRRQWIRQGNEMSYAQLEREALSAPEFRSFIDPDDEVFVAPGNIPRRIEEYCRRTSQPVPGNVGEIMRCIYESLAMKYRFSLESLKCCTNKEYCAIHMVGGGTKDRLLCQMTANACGTKVIAGPIEATVLGNIATQLLAQHKLESLSHARQVISQSHSLVTYTAQENWDNAYTKFLGTVL